MTSDRGHRAHRKGRFAPLWTRLGWAAVMALLAALLAPAAQASHYHTGSTQSHLHNMHYNTVNSGGPGTYDEQYCGQVHSSSYLTHSQATNFLQNTLTGQGDRDWDGTGDYRIDMWLAPNPCTSYPSAERAGIEMEYHYAADWSSVCGGSYGYYNCAVDQNPVYNSAYGHTDYRWNVIYLVDSSGGQLDNRGRAFINHETGHSWGLLDPRWDGDCHTPSIMHGSYTYGCTNWQNWWPSSYDYNSVVTVMNGV
ncbi:hypothetical protein [Streptomyces sp. SS8]